MPNHFHAIVWICDDVEMTDDCRGDRPVAPTGSRPGALGSLMAGFKSDVTKRINQIRKTSINLSLNSRQVLSVAGGIVRRMIWHISPIFLAKGLEMDGIEYISIGFCGFSVKKVTVKGERERICWHTV